MLTEAAKSVQPIQPRTDEWVPELCAQFSNATGWPLRYVPASHFPVGQSAGEKDSCWQAELRDGQQLVGHLRLDVPHDRPDVGTLAEVSRLSEVLAKLVEQVLSAARLVRSQATAPSTLAERGAVTAQSPDLLSTLKQLMRVGLQLTGFRSACFFLLNPAYTELRLRLWHHMAPDEVPSPNRPLNAESPDFPAVAAGMSRVLRRGDHQSAKWLPAHAAIGVCVPVQGPSGGLGTLWFFDRRLRAIEAREKQLLDALALQFAVRLEQVVMRQESSTHQRLRQELSALNEAETDAPLKTLRRPRFEAAWRVCSRFEIGGDLCDLMELSSHESALLIGDATGNSVPAAVMMTAVHGALAALLAGDRDEARQTARVLQRVNQSLFRTRRLPHFMSLIYGIFDEQALRLSYSNAGHPSPLLLRNGEVSSLDARGLLLGIVPEADYPTEAIKLCPHDLLVFYTDGISEARGANDRLFGRDGLLQALGPEPTTTDTTTLLQRVWQTVSRFVVADQADDRSLLLLRVLAE
jgi:sigma-B regulation protein RsbU (phosphoserine phosphatase)